MRFRLGGVGVFYAWYLLPTIRYGRHAAGGGFCFLMWGKWDLVGVVW